MDYFRNIVVVAALAGALAGLGMTVAQYFVTVPLIRKAQLRPPTQVRPPKQQRRLTSITRTKRMPPRTTTERAGRQRTVLNAPSSTSSPI